MYFKIKKNLNIREFQRFNRIFNLKIKLIILINFKGKINLMTIIQINLNYFE